MTIKETRAGDTLTISLTGRLDTLSAPELDSFLEKNCPAVDSLILDLADLEYISSSGLRVILKAQKALHGRGGVLIRSPNKIVSEVFAVTGFDKILHVE
ncbi:MAG: STAS domain-containing protein [Clostridia bacterium]|nr:STAS domain-containing protein [Clostridia bacterium]